MRARALIMSSPTNSSKKRSAFSLLMSGNPASFTASPPPKKHKAPIQQLTHNGPLDALYHYIQRPETFHPSHVISHTDAHVFIRDCYPKSSVHTLVLPRDFSKTLLHPLTALSTDAGFLAAIRAAAEQLKRIVAAELKRKFGEQGGRDWGKEVKVGVHSVPSMNHLHVHVLSREMESERMKNAKHYQSFNTNFFVGLDEFPLAEGDWRRGERKAVEEALKGELVCWRCGVGFGRRFKELKAHLKIEFEIWKAEGGGSGGKDKKDSFANDCVDSKSDENLIPATQYDATESDTE